MEKVMTPQRTRRSIPLPPSMLSLLASFQTTAPVDVNGLAQMLGLKVYDDIRMPDTESGKIVKDALHGGRSGYSIIVNAREPLVRQRFTVAHEIAHFLLHKDCIGDGLIDDPLYRSGLSTLQEIHANRLAADILMPYALIEAAINAGSKSIEALAKVFMVSPQAMRVRLGVPN